MKLPDKNLQQENVDVLINILEERGLGWSLDHAGKLIEVRIWGPWPHVISRYRPNEVQPLAHMLEQAMYGIPWWEHPIKNK